MEKINEKASWEEFSPSRIPNKEKNSSAEEELTEEERSEDASFLNMLQPLPILSKHIGKDTSIRNGILIKAKTIHNQQNQIMMDKLTIAPDCKNHQYPSNKQPRVCTICGEEFQGFKINHILWHNRNLKVRFPIQKTETASLIKELTVDSQNQKQKGKDKLIYQSYFPENMNSMREYLQIVLNESLRFKKRGN